MPNDNPDQPAAPAVVLAAPEADAPLADTSPAPVPQAGAITGNLMAPDVGSTAPIDLSAVEPVLPNPQSVAPQVPATEGDLTLATDPAQPRMPAVGTADPLALRGSPPEESIVPEPAAPAVPDAPDEPVADTVDSAAAAPEPAEAETPPTAPAILDAPRSSAAAPSTSLPRVGLTGTIAGAMPTGTGTVQVRRPGEATAVTTEAAPTTDLPALERYAAPFDAAESRPLMSLILIDDGTLPAGPELLRGIPFSVTVALDPGRADAAGAMNAYRAAGIELVALAQLPAGARPADVEVSYGAAFATLPETVALLDAGSGGLQDDRGATTQAMAILAADGRGFVTGSSLLNPALRAAERSAVPAGVIYRDLDGEGQDARTIRRFLDNAAFQARRESGVILLARLRPETISALILWGTANRDGQVTFAPVSAVLKVAQ